MSGAPILSRLVAVVDAPEAPVEIVAGEAERKALAAANDLLAVNALSASVEVARIPGGGITVEGRVIADVVQTCVVSLVPVDAHIDEVFAVRFVRSASQLVKPGAEIVVDPDAPDPPELLDGSSIDIGALVEEYFVLAIDPYPRAPGAVWPAELGMEPDAVDESPFAVLAEFARRSPKGPGDKK